MLPLRRSFSLTTRASNALVEGCTRMTVPSIPSESIGIYRTGVQSGYFGGVRMTRGLNTPKSGHHSSRQCVHQLPPLLWLKGFRVPTYLAQGSPAA
jgi:hypothetical protein